MEVGASINLFPKEGAYPPMAEKSNGGYPVPRRRAPPSAFGVWRLRKWMLYSFCGGSPHATRVPKKGSLRMFPTSNAVAQRRWREEKKRACRHGARRIWPDGRATSSSVCLRAHCFAKVMAPASPPKGVHSLGYEPGPGGPAIIFYGPKVVRGGAEIMLKIVFF
jgi:hypothetical protein